MQANPEVMQHLVDGRTHTRVEVWRTMASFLGQWPLRGYGMWACEAAESGKFVGCVGIFQPLDWPEPELAYSLDRPFWRQGLATEAATVAREWLFHTFPLPRLAALFGPTTMRRSGLRNGSVQPVSAHSSYAAPPFNIGCIIDRTKRAANEAVDRTYAGREAGGLLSTDTFLREIDSMTSTTTELGVATLPEAGFAPDLEERFEIARRAGVLPNLHGVVAARNGRIFFERYLAGLDAALARPLGVVRFGPDTLHDMRSVTKSIVGLLYGMALATGCVPTPEAKLIEQFLEYPELGTDPTRQRLTVGHALTMTLGTDGMK